MGSPSASAPSLPGTTSGSADPAGWLVDLFGGMVTATGLRVGVQDALRLPGVAACIQVLSEDLAKVPLVVYRKQHGGEKVEATDHPLYRLLNGHPAPWLPAFHWRRTMIHNAMALGNQFNRVQRRGGEVGRISPLQPGRTLVRWTTEGEPFYDVMDGARTVTGLPFHEVLHIPYRASNDGADYGGLWGRSPLEMHRESLALAIAAERFAARFFANGARPSVVVEMSGKMPNDQVANRVRAGLERAMGGLDNAFKIAVLEMGMKLKELTAKNSDSQLIEVRKQAALEQATMFNMPPHKIGILDRATFSNIEHQAIEYVTGPVTALARGIEAALETSCLSEAEREDYEIRHDLDDLLRGDIASRYRAYAIGRQWGWLSADDVRGWEDMNPLPHGQGKTYLTPLNMVPAGTEQRPDGSGADVLFAPTRYAAAHDARQQALTSSLVGPHGETLFLPPPSN
ncbi:phage portal protein [Azospirillum picis]|uniref:HK97 family phage portal protein n=1 Tax=Azospirillum picis TaxID=488438 RepID=A0ABU0MS22_9PROT|nr:phage portal protein [Azospirillum picis]MBP2302532.1 HK97 family phage portal protein [Azospirillum picis]MDQ0536226.1 HK97 family phage portal protein [Azospirillum picis]